MRVLGIDPGLAASGYGIIDLTAGRERLAEAGVIRPDGRELAERLCQIHRSVAEVLEEWRPEVMVIEEVYSKYRHPGTAILMAHARGVICLAAGDLALPLVHYAASEVRRALTGNGRASGRQVREMVCRRLGISSARGDDHIYDALALALCHAGRLRLAAPLKAGHPVKLSPCLNNVAQPPLLRGLRSPACYSAKRRFAAKHESQGEVASAAMAPRTRRQEPTPTRGRRARR